MLQRAWSESCNWESYTHRWTNVRLCAETHTNTLCEYTSCQYCCFAIDTAAPIPERERERERENGRDRETKKESTWESILIKNHWSRCYYSTKGRKQRRERTEWKTQNRESETVNKCFARKWLHSQSVISPAALICPSVQHRSQVPLSLSVFH